MTKFEIPKAGYWHCKICSQKLKVPVYLFDSDLNRLDFEIIQPFRNNTTLIVNGRLFENKADISLIKIVHTIKKAQCYGQKILSPFAQNIPLVFEKGEDWTPRLLYREKTVSNEVQDNKYPLVNIINNNSQTQSQIQHQEQNLSIESIQQLQDAFADFREEYKKVPNVDDSILKETQDSLDEISNNSSLTDKNKAFNKLRRVLSSAEDLIVKTGEKAAKLLSTYNTLKQLYDILSKFVI